MKKLMKILVEITADAACAVLYFIKSNLTVFATTLNLLLPYMMYFIGQYVSLNREQVAVGGEIFVPTVFVIIIYYLRSTANKLGKGITIPVPDKRFTEVDDEGEVSIANRRLQEMILYVADLEDWLERKGLL